MKGSIDAELAKFDPVAPIAEALTPPSSWYVSDQFWELDKRAVLARSWQPVARRAQLETVGSYVAGTFAGEPYVVVRTAGGLRAMSNVCRHKAMQVASGSGQCEQLVCPYHGWSYHLDGRLASAPRVAGIKSFDRDAMSLPALGLCEWGPWVFINLETEAEPLADELEELDGALEVSGWQDLTYVGTQSWTIECNWKVYVDNYLDGGYHIPHMHPSLDAQLDMSSYRTELFHRYSIQSSGAGDSGDPRTQVDSGQRIGRGAIYAWLFPNFMVNRYGPCMDSNWVLPLGPDRCQVIYEFYFRDTEGAEAQAFITQSREQADITQQEDIAISESVQCGLRSAHYDQGRYAPRVEVGEHHFHQLLHHAYREYLQG